ncbi:hypothetical protein B0H17DRAFT_1157125 [Mycena rosella]|uniref:D-xylose 1-dehydrogenase (NADP(+), D-xylono-1,5-lactone-forming) n=1 Tax=Mycena rosella TaxID=1033263 RepID=A0AAD7E1W0_MYCRO|nr:hypothetical protein B0H17DRAFT_1157125 [Mycena rosella]
MESRTSLASSRSRRQNVFAALSPQLNFGCLGAANITPGALVNPSRTHPELVLYAVAARDAKRAEEFAKEHGFQKSYDLIDDPNVHVVYNPRPNGLHFEWTMKALKGGKHVLLEKPAIDTAAEAAQIYAFAARKNLIVLEAFHYLFSQFPSCDPTKTILESEELGAIKSVTASLTTPAGTTKDNDSLEAVPTANAVPYSSRPQHKQVDKMFTATLALEKDIIGELHSNLSEPKMLGIIPRIPRLTATVQCEGGTVQIFNFLIPSYYHYITVTPGSGKARRVEKAYSFNGTAKGEDWWTTYRYQLEAFVDKVQRRTPQTWLEPQDTIDNMKWIEEIYAKDGFGSRPASNHVYGEDEK